MLIKRTLFTFGSALFLLQAAATAAVSLPADNSTTALAETAEGPAKEALQALRENRVAKAIELATPLAEKGNPDALYILGLAAESGQGATASPEKALDYFRKAAAAGHKEAGYRLSLILLNSNDETERAQAREQLEKAAKDDPKRAGTILGEAWLRGLLGKEPDFDQAAFWWNTAADAGDEGAMLLLGRLYEGQFGFPNKKDTKKSYGYYTKAAGLGNSPAMVAIGSRLLNGDEKERKEKEGREWLKKAIDKKEGSAFLVLGDFEENVKKDDKAAFDAYQRGRDAGQVDCMLRVAKAYFEGKGVTKDETRGMDVLESAAKAGNPQAHHLLAAKLMAAEKPDLNSVYGHLLAAATGSVTDAQYDLAMFYISGKLVAQDAPAGVAWLTRAAQAGHAPSQFTLGNLYLEGQGVPRSINNAGDLFMRAVNQGHPEATYAISQMFGKGIGTEPNLPRAWAFAMLADERGEKNAKAFAGDLDAKMDDAQRATAKQEFADIKAGRPLKDASGKGKDASPAPDKDKGKGAK